MTSTFLTLALLLPAAPAPAPKAAPPKGPPPRVVAVSVDAEGAPVITHTRTQSAQRQVVRTVLVGGVAQNVTETVNVAVPVTVLLRLDGEGVEVYGTDGKRIDPKDVRKLIPRAMPVLVSADGKPVDPFYLRVAREGTPVIVVPAKEPQTGAAPKGEKLPKGERPKLLPKKKD